MSTASNHLMNVSRKHAQASSDMPSWTESESKLYSEPEPIPLVWRGIIRFGAKMALTTLDWQLLLVVLVMMGLELHAMKIFLFRNPTTDMILQMENCASR